MSQKPTIASTMAFIDRLFHGVTDKGGRPYAGHCFRVMERLPAAASLDEKLAALLHDVIEDTPTTADDLRRMGYSERAIWLVEKLSRPPASAGPRLSYIDWIRSIAATSDAGLIAIKLADNADNSDPERIAALPESERSIIRRYERAREILTAAQARAAYISMPACAYPECGGECDGCANGRAQG